MYSLIIFIFLYSNNSYYSQHSVTRIDGFKNEQSCNEAKNVIKKSLSKESSVNEKTMCVRMGL